MPDFLNYSIADFIAFSPEIFEGLFLRYQTETQPAAWVALLGGLAVLWLAHHGRWQWAGWIVAAGFVWTGWAFHLERYQELNWAARYFGWGFFAEGALLALAAADAPGRRGFSLLALAIVIHPLIGISTGLNTGLALTGPDATAVAALGIALAATGWRRWLIAPLPIVWCLIALATAYGLERPALAITAGAGLLLFALVMIGRRHD